MSRYRINKTKNEIDIYGYEQYFDEEDIKSLWNEHKIMYLKGGVMALWVEERRDINPLIHIMEEDDGHIFWRKEKDIRFDFYWLDNYIETLSKVKNSKK